MTTCSRQPPAELLGDLEAEGLGALRVVGPDVDVDERPVLLLRGDLPGQPVDVVVVAVDGDQGAAVRRGGEDLLLLEVAGDQHHRADAGAGRGGGDGVREVAGRRAGEHREAEFAGGGQRDGDDPVLEGVRRVARIVLHPQGFHPELAGQVVGADELGAAGVHVRGVGDAGRHRQQRRVAPDGLGAGLDPPAQGRPVQREVVGDLERTEALGTRVEGAEIDAVSALATGERDGGAEIDAADCPDAPGRRSRWWRSSRTDVMARPFCSSSPRMRDGSGTCCRSASRAAMAAAR